MFLLAKTQSYEPYWLCCEVQAVRRCPDCGRFPVPFPLSSSGDCGHPSYKVRCSAGTLWFDALNGSSYMITSINPSSQRLVIRPPGFFPNSCIAADFRSNGIQLDNNLPFNVTSSNTVVIMNCSESVPQILLALNCSESSVCHDYINRNKLAKAACGHTSICCSLKTGGSVTAYRIRVRADRCSAYQSFVNLDSGLSVNKWPEPGVELEWTLPQEPLCRTQVNCQDLAHSECLPDPSSGEQKRCFCHSGYQWDPVNGVCKGVTIPVGGILLGIITMVLVYRKRSANRRQLAKVTLGTFRERVLSVSNGGRTAKIFSGKEILRATNNFSDDNLLGCGGFGEVFKGIIDDGTASAIKRAKPGNTKGNDQILNEVQILCQVNHKNLVRLLGCCLELKQPLLIYEYIPNGTLFDHLHSVDPGKRVQLNWHCRLVIAYQTADGLAYLHFSATPPIYHRDIKSSNILLDRKLDAKVSDFGLSRLAVTESSHITTCVQGTLGYLDPEYYINFRLTDKSDVYSFGVVLLELLTSKKAIDFNREAHDVNLVVLVRRMLNEKRLLEAVDPVLKDGASNLELETMEMLGSLAAACLDMKRECRPSMKEVAEKIEHIINLLAGHVSQT
ncbi:hypothetical protein K2173_008915 [Erythroxylum novogranatense]|uniref:Protein kinase domain-containing protein n=1 Tax=Erythroxylum novogranatense TaxID=1862640 RepID=A0AAV8S4K7_9ROSI|nr:hypothetical protein K2173_008915 [Erythroxylum novogranatense]